MSRNLLFGRLSDAAISVGTYNGFIRWKDHIGDETRTPLEAHGIQAGDTVTLSAKISSTSGKQLRLRIEFYDTETHRESRLSKAYCQSVTKTLSVSATVPEGFALFRVGLDSNLTSGTLPGNTQETITEVMLVHGDKPAVWQPAPEDVLFQKLEESDVEPGAISTGNTVVAGQTLENMKSNDSSWLTIRVRTKNIIPLLGNTAFYVNFPTNLVCFPIYFDASDLSVAAPCDAHTTKDVFIAPQGAVGVELVFKKSDNSEITPADVTNVTGGGIDMATLARASVQLEDFSGELKDLEDKTILNATALEQRLSSQILQTQEQIQQSVSEQYFTKDETNTLISQVSTAFTQTAEGWQMDFNKIVSIVNANQAATDSEFQEWSKYIRFVDGNIILGAVANPVVLTIKNDRISFAQSGQEVAYLSNAELVITDARITHGLIIGKFGFIPRANGSLDFKKVL